MLDLQPTVVSEVADVGFVRLDMVVLAANGVPVDVERVVVGEHVTVPEAVWL